MGCDVECVGGFGGVSYEVQGRQYHQWFGHGAGDGAAGGERALTAAEVARVVAAGAAASLSGALRADYEGWLTKGGLRKLEAAVPVWADASGLEAGRFRSLVVGPGLRDEGAGALQDVGRLVRGARDPLGLQAASERLAAAVEAGGAEWRHGLSYARDAAVYARVNGLVPAIGPRSEAGRDRDAGPATPR